MDIIGLVKAAVTILATVAKYTATTVDDQIAAFLTAALDNPVILDLLHLILHDQDVITQKDGARDAAMHAAIGRFDGSRLDSIKAFLAGLGITWESVLNYLPLIIRLFLTMQGKR